MTKQSSIPLKRGQSIVFDGDSLTSRRMRPSLDTWPYLRLMNWEGTYADRVAEWLFCNRPDLRTTCHSAAIGGSTAADCLQHYPDTVKPHKPAWVIMTIGGNDRARKVPLREFSETLSEYCRRLTADSGGRLMILGGFKPFPFVGSEKEIYLERVAYYRASRRVLASHNGVFVDVGAALFRKAQQLAKLWEGHTVYSDGRHLNPVGSEIVATQALQALGVLGLPE